MVEGQKDVRGVETSSILLEAADLTQVKEQLATGAVLKDEEEFAVALEGVIHLHYELMSDIFLNCVKNTSNTYQNASLSHRMLHLVASDDLSLFQSFQCVKLASVLLLDKSHLAVRAFPNH